MLFQAPTATKNEGGVSESERRVGAVKMGM